jgi:hypothetical protein
MTDETQQSVAPQVLGVLGVLYFADGDLYGISRTWIALDALKTVTTADLTGQNVAARTHRYFMNYVEQPEQAVAEMDQAIDDDAGNALLYALRGQATYRIGALQSNPFDPPELAVNCFSASTRMQQAPNS